MTKVEWPMEPGEYTVCSETGSISVVTLADEFDLEKENLALYGKLRTENLGIERIIVNTITNPNIRYLIVCGREIRGHNSGQSITSLWQNGLDENKRIIGSKGALPFIQNLPRSFVDRFREQIELVNLIDTDDPKEINKKIRELAKKKIPAFEGEDLDFTSYGVKEEKVERKIVATGENSILVSGEYGIIIDPESGLIVVNDPAQ